MEGSKLLIGLGIGGLIVGIMTFFFEKKFPLWQKAVPVFLTFLVLYFLQWEEYAHGDPIIGTAKIIVPIEVKHPPKPATGTKDPLRIQTKNSPVEIPDKGQDADQAAIKKEVIVLPVVDISQHAVFAVMGLNNGIQDKGLELAFVSWLGKTGTASRSVLLKTFLEQGYFDQILDNNAGVVKNTNASLAAEHICLIRCTSEYSPSNSITGVTIFKTSYEIKIVRTKDGKVLDEFEKESEKYSGVSKDAAKKSERTALMEFLNNHKLNL